jgi:hypothetical protein
VTDDNWSDIDLDSIDNPISHFAVPTDHPAFRPPEDGEDGSGYDPATSQHDGLDSPFGNPIVQLPVGRYDGFSNQDDSQMVGVDGTDDPRQRTADRQYIADRLDRARETIATRAIGQRNAIAHSRSVGEGEGSGDDVPPTALETALAESLEQAGVRFRDERESRSGDNAAVKLPYTMRGITRVPTFQSAAMTGQLYGLKSNTAGDWMVTLKIDADCEDAPKLAKAHGLQLEVAIKRKMRDE